MQLIFYLSPPQKTKRKPLEFKEVLPLLNYILQNKQRLIDYKIIMVNFENSEIVGEMSVKRYLELENEKNGN